VSGRVIVVGSINIDLVVRGVRLPAPGETVSGGVFERHHGGKGANQAVAAARLGAQTTFVGAVGGDRFGEEARAALVAEGVDASELLTLEDEASGVALVLVDETGENVIAVAPGANGALSPEAVGAAFESLRPRPGDIVLVSREIRPAVVAAALAGARAGDARTILNPAPADYLDRTVLGDVDLLTPNRRELAAIAGAPDDSPEALAGRILDPGGVREAIVVTLGANGGLIVDEHGPRRAPAPAVSGVDATGAGDAFNGALAAGLAQGRQLDDAVARAVAAASISTTVPGAREGMPTLGVLEATLARS
jgi:ribokinase